MEKYGLVRGTTFEKKQAETKVASKSDPGDEKAVSRADRNKASGREREEVTDYSSWIESRQSLGKGGKKPRSPNQAILNAAVEQAKLLGQVENMKVCYRSDQDEWWIFIYHNLGAGIDVKRFVWDWNSQTLKPFLVIKRVSKSKLSDELKKQERGESCEVLTLRREKR